MTVNLIFDKSSKGQNSYTIPVWKGPESVIPEKYPRGEINLPDCREPRTWLLD